MSNLPVTDDFSLGMELPMDPSLVRMSWIDALKYGRFRQGRKCLALGDERCVFGVLCEVCQELELIRIQPYEWERELPPYSVCLLAGVDFNFVSAGEAMGMDVDAIYTYADRTLRTQREVAIMVEQRFEQRSEREGRTLRFDFEATPGLGGNGVGTLIVGGDLMKRSKQRRV